MTRTLARLIALTAVWAGIELLERVSYAAGVDEAAAVLVGPGPGDPAAVDEDLDAVDLSDVVWLHVREFHGPEAPRAGECAC